MKRNLFDELNEGFTALISEREGKITLKQFTIEKKPGLTITPQELLTLRERLNLSRSVFARYLRINQRTLENWEQGRARPNAQAAVLIRLIEHYPDTVELLSAI